MTPKATASMNDRTAGTCDCVTIGTAPLIGTVMADRRRCRQTGETSSHLRNRPVRPALSEGLAASPIPGLRLRPAPAADRIQCERWPPVHTTLEGGSSP